MGHEARNWRGFWVLLFVQALNAFNEKGTQFLLIPLGAALYGQVTHIEYTLSALIVLPYLLFSPLVGWLSDRYCKARIIQVMMFVQIAVMAGVAVSLYRGNMNGAIFWFSLFAIQATVFSPAKKGIVKDILGEKHLGFASGLMEMMVVLALLAGQIGVFVWFDHLYSSGEGAWMSAIYPLLAMMGLAIPFAFLSFYIPRCPVLERRSFSWGILYEHVGQIKELWADKRLRYSELGISYFWFFGSVLLLIALQIAKEETAGQAGYGSVGASLMGWLSGGIVIGGVVVSILSRHKIQMKAAHWGAVIMMGSCLLLTLLPMGTAVFSLFLAVAGAGAAAFLVPLNAYFQNTSDNARRGNMIAAGNCLDMLLSLLAVGVQMGFMMAGIPPKYQFVLLAGITFCAYFYSLGLLHRKILRYSSANASM